MFRKSFTSFLLPAVLLFTGSLAVFGQTAPSSGRIMLQKADGSTEPVAGAVIEVYRTDIQLKAPSGKSNKDGSFAFAGMMLGATYLLSVSAPGSAPQVRPGVRAGNDNIVITLLPGDGSKLSEADARASATRIAGSGPGGPPQPSADDKKRQAEYEAKKAEVESKNVKAQKANELVASAFKAGKEAFDAKNYDLAIAKYDEGIAADPEFLGSAPVLMNNRGVALRARAVDTYNAAIKNTDSAATLAGKLKAKEDLMGSINVFVKSYTMLKNGNLADISDKTNYELTKTNALRGAKESLGVAARIDQVDPTMIDAAKAIMPDYLATETDAAKKLEAQIVMGDLYRTSGDYAAAIDAYKKVLEVQPENADALAMVGICLFAQGAINNNDKALYQEGANYLQKYVAVAPEGHRYKKDAMDTLEQLKNEQKVTPQKAPSGGKKRGS